MVSLLQNCKLFWKNCMKRILLFLCVFSSIVLCAADVKSQPIRLNGSTQEVLSLVKQYVPLKPTIIEAGGCDGTDTAIILQSWPDGYVHTFEPLPEHFATISKKFNGMKNFRCYQKALSDKCGTADFYVSVTENIGLSGSSSLLSPKEHLTIDPTITFPEKLQISVETTTIDAWAKKEKIKQVDFIWLDTQGAEMSLIRDSEIAKNAKAIYLEVEFIELYENVPLYNEIKEWMKKNNFTLLATDFDEENLPWYGFGNALFIKN